VAFLKVARRTEKSADLNDAPNKLFAKEDANLLWQRKRSASRGAVLLKILLA
jgi:hypothetical protein